MNSFGSRSREAWSLSLLVLYLLGASGARVIGRCVSSCWPSASSACSPCRSTIRRPPLWGLLLRALLLVLGVMYATRLGLAEVHYARGWPPIEFSQRSLDSLERARDLFPWRKRFRDGPMLRMKLFVERGL